MTMLRLWRRTDLQHAKMCYTVYYKIKENKRMYCKKRILKKMAQPGFKPLAACFQAISAVWELGGGGGGVKTCLCRL